MSIEIIYNFEFKDGNIFEVKFKNLSDKAEKKHRFQWYLMLNNRRYDLQLIGISEKNRLFRCNEYDLIFLDWNSNQLIIQTDNKIDKYPITEKI